MIVENWEQYKDLEYYPDHFCNCPCEGGIKVRFSHKYDGIPRYILGHGKGRNFSLVAEVEAILRGEKEAPFCGCDCGGRIVVLPQHKHAGIPKYIHGHNNRGKSPANKGKVGSNKNKTWEEIYGVEKAAEMREGVKIWTKTPEAIEKANKTRRETYEKNGGLNHPPDCTCGICKAVRGEYKGENNPFYGKKQTEESIRKSVAGNKKRYQEGTHKNCDLEFDKKRRENVVKALQTSPTSYEQKIIELVSRNNLSYKFVGDGTYWVTSEGKHINPDFISTNDKKIIIEVFASVFKVLMYGSVDEYKKERSRLFGNFGFKVIYIDENDLKIENWEKHCLQIIKGD